MYIDKISLRNIRGFEKLDFSLKRPDGGYAGWTVFTGDNGSGKSTLLKAIAIALISSDSARGALQSNFDHWIREGVTEQDASIELVIAPEKGSDEFLMDSRTAYIPFSAKLILRDSGKDIVIERDDASGTDKMRIQRQHGLWSSNAKGWFACGYGPFRRVFGASLEATRLMTGSTTERFVTLFHEGASLSEVDQWLKNLRFKALEGKTSEKEQLDLLLELLRDDFMPDQITVDSVDSDGLWLKGRNGLKFGWGEMSDGYRSALALLVDILRHLINTFGMLGLIEHDADGKLIITRSGVVMIDEVDAHLHPEWQREIGFWLKRHFPHIQFLVTTHSPLICQAADENGLFVLPEPGSAEPPRALSAEDYRTIIAARPDTILRTPAFGLQNTRSPRAVEARAEYSHLQSKKRAGAELSDEETQHLEQSRLFAEVDEEA